ncbi:MAG: hypothetical protein NTY20_01805 [Candidatus Aenigmarchaeota archaeon]|nr:hypothetical protein [Candidatus Aenigmarchaeota archaeon]
MRLSESIRRDILETRAEGIINKFKIYKRRNVLLFEEILANYIKACEDSGYKEDMNGIAKTWSFLYTKNFLPEFMFKMPKTVLLNRILKKVWINLGLLDDFKASIKDNTITFFSHNESITRCIGKNEFCNGLWEGVISGLYGRYAESLSSQCSFPDCIYTYSLKDIPFNIESKSKNHYVNLNKTFAGKGELQKYLKMKIIVLKGNHMYFRKKSVVIGENTIFHIFGSKNILMGKVPDISHLCFSAIIDSESTVNEKIFLLKNILEVFGWGKVKIIYGGNRIEIEISNPPFGIQKEEDNWTFFANMILGYIFLINRKASISEINFGKNLKILYSIRDVFKK